MEEKRAPQGASSSPYFGGGVLVLLAFVGFTLALKGHAHASSPPLERPAGLPMVRLTLSMTSGSTGAVGTLTLSMHSRGHSVTRTVRTARVTLTLAVGVKVRLRAAPASPALWSFGRWKVTLQGHPAHFSTRPDLALTLTRSTSVHAEFVSVDVPAATPPSPTITTTASQVPTPGETPAPVTPAAMTATAEPICRSWHPKPRCAFPTPTATQS
jgi:hypothetical protein